jgi:beta-glucuronidase
LQYQGPAWYRRAFQVPEGGTLRLHFGGVFYHARVYLDGRYLGKHEGGYSPFTFVVPGIARGTHEIILRVHNLTTDTMLPKNDVDWFPYGGPFRPVFVELVPATFIDRYHVLSEMNDDGGGAATKRLEREGRRRRPSTAEACLLLAPGGLPSPRPDRRRREVADEDEPGGPTSHAPI